MLKYSAAAAAEKITRLKYQVNNITNGVSCHLHYESMAVVILTELKCVMTKKKFFYYPKISNLIKTHLDLLKMIGISQ